MIEPNKRVTVFLVAAAFVLASFSPPCSEGGDIKMTWQEETLSADLSGVSLESVLEHLSAEQGIWFKVHKSVGDHKVSVYFTELSLEEGLKRIFAGLDYSLEFDGQGNPCGIVIVGEKESARGKAKGATAARKVPQPDPDTTGPMEPDNPDEPDEEMSSPFGPLGPAKSPVESADDGLSPYGPTGRRAKGQEDPKGIDSPSSPVESGETSWPYGPGYVNPEMPKSAEGSKAPPSPVKSASPPPGTAGP